MAEESKMEKESLDKVEEELAKEGKSLGDSLTKQRDEQTLEEVAKPKKKKKTKKKSSVTAQKSLMDRGKTEETAAGLKRQSTVEEFIQRVRSSRNVSDRVLVDMFCIEQDKPVLLPVDWNVSIEYRKTGNIKDLLEYIHKNVRRRK